MGIKIPGVQGVIDERGSIVIIGPNGVGKTRLGVAIARQNNAERIAALRQVEIPGIPMKQLAAASQEVKQALNQSSSEPWRQAYELQNLMAEILAEDRQCAVAYREEHVKNPQAEPDKKLTNTRLRRIVKIWNRHFSGREINIDYEPTVFRVSKNGSTAKYPIAQMSEGERTALYLAARVISCKSNVIVVDEPETFLHPLLARNLWVDLEAEAPQIQFIYITHDIPFALSRKNARFAIARAEDVAELLPPTSSIPAEIVTEVLGAASFSISASRLIFCEGEPRSLDNPILSAWHDCPKTAVVPVGSCNAVRECVSVFRSNQVTSGLEAFGYIDRDGWPDEYLRANHYVKAHLVSEIEGVFCLESVFKALAKYNGADDSGAQTQFDAFIKEARELFRDVLLNKQILMRAKMRVEVDQKALLNPIRPNPDLAIVRQTFSAAQPVGGWSAYLQTIFNEEEARVTLSLNGSVSDFVRDFPAKSYFEMAAKHLQYVPEKMLRIFCDALKLTDERATSEQKLKELRDTITPVLEPMLWPRKA